MIMLLQSDDGDLDLTSRTTKFILRSGSLARGEISIRACVELRLHRDVSIRQLNADMLGPSLSPKAETREQS
jgi:hypothetical protein